MAEAASRAPTGTGSSLLEKRRHARPPAARHGENKPLPNRTATQRHSVGPLHAGQGFIRAIDFRHVG